MDMSEGPFYLQHKKERRRIINSPHGARGNKALCNLLQSSNLFLPTSRTNKIFSAGISNPCSLKRKSLKNNSPERERERERAEGGIEGEGFYKLDNCQLFTLQILLIPVISKPKPKPLHKKTEGNLKVNTSHRW